MILWTTHVSSSRMFVSLILSVLQILLSNTKITLLPRGSFFVSGNSVFGNKKFDIKPKRISLLLSLFYHSGFAHLFNNVLVLLIIGPDIEITLGSLLFLVLFFGGGLVGQLCSILYHRLYFRKQWNEGIAQFIETCGSSPAIYALWGFASLALPGPIGSFFNLSIAEKYRQVTYHTSCKEQRGIMAQMLSLMIFRPQVSLSFGDVLVSLLPPRLIYLFGLPLCLQLSLLFFIVRFFWFDGLVFGYRVPVVKKISLFVIFVAVSSLLLCLFLGIVGDNAAAAFFCYLLFNLVASFFSVPSYTDHASHMGGYLFGCILSFILTLIPESIRSSCLPGTTSLGQLNGHILLLNICIFSVIVGLFIISIVRGSFSVFI